MLYAEEERARIDCQVQAGGGKDLIAAGTLR
jgi:hypothetical protein